MSRLSKRPPNQEPWLVLGIMSGTSIDSVDYALCWVEETRVRLERHWQAGFPRSLQRRLHEAARGQANSHEVGQLHHDLGRFYALGARQGVGRDRPVLAGVHGQTIFHHPARRPTLRATLQIGEPVWLAQALGLPVINNFRAADLAAGGQGAPLATLFHRVAFGRPGAFVCVNNLGGISNVTAIDWRQRPAPRLLAFDTGPANVLLDIAMRDFTHGRRPCDRDGTWARRGEAIEGFLEHALRHRFFRQRPPKSTGRELFGEQTWRAARCQLEALGASPFDMLATLTEFTARSLALNYRLHLGGRPDRVVLAGGGAANPELVQAITRLLRNWHPEMQVTTSDRLGWPLQAIEPAAFALLAYYRARGLPGNIPATTGATRPVLCGQITEAW